jgi:hypothetical protein
MRLYKALIRSRMEYGPFLFQKLKKKQGAIRGALGYHSSTPTDVMLAEAKKIPIFGRFRQFFFFVLTIVTQNKKKHRKWVADIPGIKLQPFREQGPDYCGSSV